MKPIIAPLVALGALLVSTISLAQELPVTRPEAVGMSSARLQRIASAVQQSIDEHRITGAVTMIVRHGQVAWLDARGLADREAGKPMQPDSLFRICSMTKPITSVAVMMLYEEGKFLLADPVAQYLPEFRNAKVLVKPATGPSYTIPASRDITILDLLRHTSGLTYPWNETVGPAYAAAGAADGLNPYDGTIADSVKRLAGLPLLFNPGERFEYSLSVDVLGRLVEVVSGMSLDEFFRTRQPRCSRASRPPTSIGRARAWSDSRTSPSSRVRSATRPIIPTAALRSCFRAERAFVRPPPTTRASAR
jgi:CubicO group peptidase (beta-lactamase class C family)